MSAPLHNTSTNRRALKIVATIVAAVVVLFLLNSTRSESQDSAASVSTQSILSLPLQNTPALPTAVPTTAPLSLPAATATPAPTSTPAPTATAVPTALPTPTPEPTPEPTPSTAVSVAGTTASADVQPAPAEDPAPVEEPALATAIPEPTATAEPEPTASAEPEPNVEATAEPEPTVEATAEPTPEPTPEPTAVPVQTAAELEAYVIGEINAIRAGAGLAPIALDPTISVISRDWSQQMAAGGFFSHRPKEQLDVMLPSGWRQWGENIASAPDIFYAQDSLEASPGHYANMVGPFTHVGIGVFTNGSQVWVTQNFARYE